MAPAWSTYERRQSPNSSCTRTRSTIASRFSRSSFQTFSQKSMNWIRVISRRMHPHNLSSRPDKTPKQQPPQPPTHQILETPMPRIISRISSKPTNKQLEPTIRRQSLRLAQPPTILRIRRTKSSHPVRINRIMIDTVELLSAPAPNLSAKTCGNATTIAWFVIAKVSRTFKD